MIRKLVRLGLICVCIVMVLVASALAYMRAQATFPNPTGPFQVGKTAYDLIDSTRKESLGSDPHASREIMVTVYYPAHPAIGMQFGPYADDATMQAWAHADHVPVWLPKFLFAQDHTFANAPLATDEAAYPVVLFSPGWGNVPLNYTTTLEDLASHGYIVVALWHTFSSGYTVFPDGRVVTATRAGSDPDKYTSNEDELYSVRTRVGDVWLGDVRLVLDQLVRWNADDARLAGHLDLGHIGIFGHSFGGTVALAAGASDPRLTAVIDVDGSLAIGRTNTRYLDRPTLLMRSDDPHPTEEDLKDEHMTRQDFQVGLANLNQLYVTFYEHSRPAYLFTLKGSAHLTYASEYALVAPAVPILLTQQLIGDIAGRHAVQVYDTYITAFFDKHLKGISTRLLEGGPAQDYPDVLLSAHL